VLLLVLIPNPLQGRLAFLFCGGMMAGIGGVLIRGAKAKHHQSEAQPHLSVASPVSNQSIT